jgi:hypothetical protein
MNTGFTFRHVGLIVTGEGEEQFLPRFLRALLIDGDCTFEVVRRIGQRSEVRSPARRLRMVGSGKVIPTIDEEQIGLPARRFLTEPRHEHARWSSSMMSSGRAGRAGRRCSDGIAWRRTRCSQRRCERGRRFTS